MQGGSRAGGDRRAETTIARHTGCVHSDLELWTLHGGSHIPTATQDFGAIVWSWLSAHARP